MSISPEEAQEIAQVWRGKYANEDAFEASWARYFETATVPETSRLANWLACDLERMRARQAGRPATDSEYVRAERGVCPLCRDRFDGEYLDHIAIKHRVRERPDSSVNNLGFDHKVRSSRYLAACQAAGVE